MYAAPIRASHSWRRVVLSQFELKQIEDLRQELDAEFTQKHPQQKSTASHSHLSSKQRT
jgi:hypothetical protein